MAMRIQSRVVCAVFHPQPAARIPTLAIQFATHCRHMAKSRAQATNLGRPNLGRAATTVATTSGGGKQPSVFVAARQKHVEHFDAGLANASRHVVGGNHEHMDTAFGQFRHALGKSGL